MDTLALLLIIGAGLYFMSDGQFFANILKPSGQTGAQPSGQPAGQTSGGLLSPSQIAQLASIAGFTGADLVTSVAIALAESGGDPNAHGDLSLGQGSFGLWQIYSGAHPEFGPDFSMLFDPLTNAQAAYSIYLRAGNSFAPWTGTYGTGKYLAFMGTAQTAVG